MGKGNKTGEGRILDGGIDKKPLGHDMGFVIALKR